MMFEDVIWTVKNYLVNIFLAIDQLINVIFGGDPNETISLRASKSAKSGHVWGCYFCKFLDFFDRDHCFKVISYDEGELVAEQYAPRGNPHWQDYAVLRWSVPMILGGAIMLWLMQ